MTDFVTRRFGGLTVRVDRSLCVGFGDCLKACPELWVFDSAGVITFQEPTPPIERERLLRSCEVCPVDALAVFDPDGNRLIPKGE